MKQKKKIKQNKPDRLAVVDIGSNSVRLVLYKLRSQNYKSILDKKTTCRLALDMQHDKPRLNARGMAMTLKTLKNFRKIIKKNKVTYVVAIGTAALRSVASTKEGQEFYKKAANALGHKIKIISGVEEARLTARGLMSHLPKAVGICGDLGGGSLELAAIKNGKILHTTTSALGTLTLLSETKGDALLTEFLTNQRLKKISWLQHAKGQTFYAIGGSWRGVGRIMMQEQGISAKNIHGYSLRSSLAKSMAIGIAQSSPEMFKNMHPKISKRANIIPVAAATLAKLIDIIRPQKITFSGHGIREGIAQQVMHKSRKS